MLKARKSSSGNPDVTLSSFSPHELLTIVELSSIFSSAIRLSRKSCLETNQGEQFSPISAASNSERGKEFFPALFAVARYNMIYLLNWRQMPARTASRL